MARIYKLYECLACGHENDEPAMDWDDDKGCRLCPDCGSLCVQVVPDHLIDDGDADDDDAYEEYLERAERSFMGLDEF
jgi:transcription elongation factor Elf1